MRTRTALLAVSIALSLGSAPARAQGPQPWSVERAQAWGKRAPWLVGCNFNPSTAINQLEMWQSDSFDPATIDRELGWAQELGFNSIRVFLHNIPYEQDAEGFLKRIDTFLAIADRHKIGVMFVLFDSVWDPDPKPGRQRAPRPHVHNSGWVQSPGLAILKDRARHETLRPYVVGVIKRFRDDRRVQAWDLFNEPDNRNESSYGRLEPPDKADLALALLKNVFEWARRSEPTQPLAAGVWTGDWSEGKLSPMNRFQLEQSDIISFHDYSPMPLLKARVLSLKRFGRPLLCTEYMARPNGSTFDPALVYLGREKIGAYNWGFVAGKSQTIYPWDSWKKTYTAEPPVWFHDIFRADGAAYDPKEIAFIKETIATVRVLPN